MMPFDGLANRRIYVQHFKGGEEGMMMMMTWPHFHTDKPAQPTETKRWRVLISQR